MRHTKASILTLGFLLLPTGAGAGITEVTIRVDGLSCPFCAYSLEKSISAVPGTRDPVIDVEAGIVTLSPADEGPVHFAALQSAVKNAGFTPRELHITGTAVLQLLNGAAALLDEHGDTLFLLESTDGLPDVEPARAVDFTGIFLPPQEGQEPGGTPFLRPLTVASHDKNGGTP